MADAHPPGRPLGPSPTVDILIETPDGLVLIERKNPPHGWALPGGFVNVGETLAAAARREALEETSLEVEILELLGCYSDPARDPRGHTVSTGFIARARGTPRAADDAAALAVFPLDRLPAPLAFDHGRILEDYRAYRHTGRRPSPER